MSLCCCPDENIWLDRVEPKIRVSKLVNFTKLDNNEAQRLDTTIEP